MMRLDCCAALLSVLLAGHVRAESKTYDITVAAGDHDRTNEPVRVPLNLPTDLAKATNVVIESPDGKKFPGQLTGLGLLSPPPLPVANLSTVELHFILPSLKAGQSATFKATVSTDKPGKLDTFAWSAREGESIDLTFGQKPVLRYMNAPFDESTKEKRDLTYKVFHHLYDPDGEVLLTNGTGAKLYPHHRGIYYGFNKVTYGDDLKKTADVWHCTKGSHQSHEKVLVSEAGPVLARQRVLISWHGDDKATFAREERELTVYHVPGGQLVDFASRVSTAGGKIHLDGDPQHAGFHFRANPEVADKTAKQTYYVRPDGADKLDATRNWDPKDPEKHINLPWNAMSFIIGDQRYTVAYLDRPQNPKPGRFSERDYGRFGSYFVADVEEQKPLDVAYRLWVQKGEMKVDDVAGHSHAFVKPVTATVK